MSQPRAVPDGVVLVAKEAGPTSHDIVALVRRLSGVRRVGHGGTLDPFAAGVLPVFVGQATRLAEYHLGDDKEYRALIAFGARSTTDDLEGELTPLDAPPPARAAVEEALSKFLGQVEQVPPDYSAVHVGGRRAYELARHGRKPELRPRAVTFHRLELAGWDDSIPERPVATAEMRCSAGTYVRALARDLGQRLGTGAYLAALTRTASGPFRLDQAHPLDRVREELAAGRAAAIMLPPDAGLETLRRVTLEGRNLQSLLRGQAVAAGRLELAPPLAGDELVRVAGGDGRLAAIARLRDGRLQPEKVLVPLAQG
ncbi:MAG TPA: tRNA pseudouridine(55) synthase TruB [Candidatus Limnocylindrales bacterium]|nr:tRNA pseudouridine(55) synthase TruB [Candidatus Limnocylindrales bacterium]